MAAPATPASIGPQSCNGSAEVVPDRRACSVISPTPPRLTGVWRPWIVIALMLAACQPQNPAEARGSPTNPPGDLLYIQDPGGPRMLQLNWSGKVVGWVSAQGFAVRRPTAHGSSTPVTRLWLRIGAA